ncbi:hypothetical protein ACHWQZ_G004617 [Mnemiopsis leidyi]
MAEPMDLMDALRETLKNSLIVDGVTKGLRESVKKLDKREAMLCVLAESTDEKNILKLVEALCREHGINLIKIDDAKKLGEWVGLCKIDKEGNARKVVRCSCAVISDFGRESIALEVINDHFKRSVAAE